MENEIKELLNKSIRFCGDTIKGELLIKGSGLFSFEVEMIDIEDNKPRIEKQELNINATYSSFHIKYKCLSCNSKTIEFELENDGKEYEKSVEDWERNYLTNNRVLLENLRNNKLSLDDAKSMISDLVDLILNVDLILGDKYIPKAVFEFAGKMIEQISHVNVEDL